MVSGYAPAKAVLSISLVFTALALSCVILRLFTRIRISRSSGLDDVFITLSMVFSVLLAAATGVEVHYGLGRHTVDVTLPDEKFALLGLYLTINTYNLTMGCTKLSILLQYLRVLPQTHNRARKACYTLMAVVSVYVIQALLTGIFTCWPPAKFWDITITTGHCMNRTGLWFSNAAFNILTDVAIGVFPLPIVRALNVPKRTKLALMIVLGLGGFTCIVSILRLEALYAVTHTTDQFYNNGQVATWSVVEANTGIICSCLPTLRVLISRCLPALFPNNHVLSNVRLESIRTKNEVLVSMQSRSKLNSGELQLTTHDSGQQSYISPASRCSTDADMDTPHVSPLDIKFTTIVEKEIARSPAEMPESRIQEISDYGRTRPPSC
ncbi:MAG: hypothetical protein FE78DRAFT_181591 [Acidomyces sp. 'richmondensis']|nr:MAG: hypothetical protein FE78DRAFT_181591 [Acidomyces sp. 'richmondensis']